MHAATERFFDDFVGNQAIAAGTCPWAKADTSSSGAPTLTGVTGVTSSIEFLLDSTNEAQALALYMNDILPFKVNDLISARFRLKTTSNLAANQVIVFGLQSARNDNSDTPTYNAQFKLTGDMSILVETDDNSTDDDDNDTTLDSVAATFKEFVIDFRNGITDVRFYVSDAAGKLKRVLSGTTFSLIGATGTYLQPFVQLQKSTGTTTPNLVLDYVEVNYRRS